MNKRHARALLALEADGWSVQRASVAWQIPEPISSRYDWVVPELWGFLCGVDRVVAPDEQAWFLTGRDFCGASDSAFSWDEWERQSFEAADGDFAWRAEIREFWDCHLPLAASVRSGYAYLALKRSTHAVVMGEEPEFEETSEIARSVGEFFDMLIERADALGRWK